MQGLVEPSSQQKIRLCAREAVLKPEQREEIGRKQAETFAVAATICLDGPLVNIPGVVGEHLARQVGQIVTVCRRVAVLLRRLAEKDQRIDELCRVVLEPFGTPCRNAGNVQSGAGAEDGFEGPFPLDCELAVDRLQQQPPGFVDMAVPCAVAVDDVPAQVVVRVGGFGLPGRLHGPVVDHRIGGDTLGKDAHAAEEAFGFGAGFVRPREDHRKLPAHVGFAAEVVHGGPDPRGAVKLPGVPPRRTALSEEVDDHGQRRVEPCEQLFLRIAAPALKHPLRSGEVPLHGGLDHRCRAGYVHSGRIASFVEEVASEVFHRVAVEFPQDGVVAVGHPVEERIFGKQDRRAGEDASPQSLTGDPGAGVFLPELVGHHPPEALQDGFDTQFGHPRQDTLLHPGPAFHHAAAHRAAPSFEIAHEPPCRESRPRNEIADFLFGESCVFQRPGPYEFGSQRGEHEVDAVQGHPVEFALPVVPVVKRVGVVICTVIQGVAVAERRTDRHRRGDLGQRRQIVQVVAVVRQAHSAKVVQVVIDGRGCRRRRSGLDRQPSPACGEGECVAVFCGVGSRPEIDLACQERNAALYEPGDAAEVGLFRIGFGQGRNGQEQGEENRPAKRCQT